jgi:glucose PTS system EIICB or EIICBA component
MLNLYYEKILINFFTKLEKIKTKEKIKIKKSDWKARFFSRISKLSSSFLIVIAVLPIAGFFLGIGSSFIHFFQEQNNLIFKIGFFMQKLGSIIFDNLSVLFCVSLAIGFSKGSGIAGLVSLISFLIFQESISAFIVKVGDDNYSLLFYKDLHLSIFKNVLGIFSINTGIISGIFIGCFTAYFFNRYSEKKLPKVFEFFSGVRFMPIVMFIFTIPFAIFFATLWPFLGLLLEKFGELSGKASYGIDSFIFHLVHRALTPFGLHHAFYLPLWTTSAGGSLGKTVLNFLKENFNKSFSDYKSAVDWINSEVGQKSLSSFNSIFEGIHIKDWHVLEANGDQTISFIIMKEPFFKIQHVRAMGLRIGRFGPSGWFPYMIFGLPAAAFAMWASCPKKNRRLAFGIYSSAALTSILTGITEPLEFTFLFASPLLYYFVHVPLSGISGLFSNLTQSTFYVSVPAFFGGLIDLIGFGVVPFIAGHKTGFYFVPVIGIPIAIFYYFLFFFLIKKFDFKIPGRKEIATDVKDIKLSTSKEWKEKIYGKNIYKTEEVDKSNSLKLDINKFAFYLGGIGNCLEFFTCATRLRVIVKDKSLVKKEDLINLGIANIQIVGNEIQLILGFGVEPSNVYVNALNKLKEEKLSKKE